MVPRARVQGDRGVRRAPVEFQDAAELHFRRDGRHASIVWIPEPVCQWQVKITLRGDDPALGAWQAGEVSKEPFEVFEITYWDEEAGLYVGYELGGTDGLSVGRFEEMLKKADSWSGAGQFGSIEEAMSYQVQSQYESRERLRKYLKDEVMAAARAVRKQVAGEPVVTVGIDFNESSPSGADNQEKM